MEWWEAILDWAQGWNETQGFWTAVQGAGTLLAAVAALVALSIAKSQLSALTRSNELLADSNDAMTRSNAALTRPYVVVDFDFLPEVTRDGNMSGSSILVLVENVGRTPAKNLRLKADPPFPVPNDPSNPGWAPAVEELNRVMNGETVIRSLTHVRNLRYYVDEAKDIMGSDDKPAEAWTVEATYEDSDGNEYRETFALELSHWRRAIATADPLHRIAKGIQGVAYEIKNKKVT